MNQLLISLCLFLASERHDRAAVTIEHNTVTYGGATTPLEQVIVWDDSTGRVRGWRMADYFAVKPRKNDWLVFPRAMVRVSSVKHTVTKHDPEIRDQNLLPACERRGLW